MISPVELDSIEPNQKIFSICTLVRDHGLYQRMLKSFEQAKFIGDTVEYLYIDNSKYNKFDGYAGGHRLIRAAKGKYVIFCHEDVEVIDLISGLSQRLEALQALDPSWAICGNAGGASVGDLAIRITDPQGENRCVGEPYPKKVFNLDENFIIVKSDALVSPSYDLTGFHFYGTDICLQAYVKGRTAYVVDYHVRHMGGASQNRKKKKKSKEETRFMSSFFQVKTALVEKYSNLMKSRWFHSPNAKFFLCGNVFLRFFGNRKIIFSVVRHLRKII